MWADATDTPGRKFPPSFDRQEASNHDVEGIVLPLIGCEALVLRERVHARITTESEGAFGRVRNVIVGLGQRAAGKFHPLARSQRYVRRPIREGARQGARRDPSRQARQPGMKSAVDVLKCVQGRLQRRLRREREVTLRACFAGTKHAASFCSRRPVGTLAPCDICAETRAFGLDLPQTD